jgi:hypothetical protein
VINQLIPLVARKLLAVRTFAPDGAFGKLWLRYIDGFWIGVCDFTVSENFVAFGTSQNPAGHKD